ncbi:MAG: carbohydrate ABC transporter permease, partial [Clostridiales bacterium]|nr:carbohydrate ABC transporter permease [Clostridiales bacterium]
MAQDNPVKAAHTGLISNSDLARTSTKILYAAILAILILFVFICVVPPVWVMTSSLKDAKEFFSVPATIIPKTWHPEKLLETWNTLNFGKYYLNTLFVVIGTIAVSVSFNGMLGYVLSRLKPVGSKLILALVLWTMMLPTSMSMVPLFKSFLSLPVVGLNVTESYIPMWILAGANAFYVLVFKSNFDGVPISLIESARLDGCNNLTVFFRILLPISKAVIVVIVI